MKKLSIWMILSSWILYVLVPIVFKFIYGFYPENIYTMGYVPQLYMTRAAIIISFVFFICIVLIHLSPSRNDRIIETKEGNVSYYYITLFIYIILSVRAGITSDYTNVIAGGVSGAFISYYSMFFYPAVLFLIFLFCIRERGSILLLAGSYLALTLLTHSRSGAVHLGVYMIGFAYASGLLSIKSVRQKTGRIYKKYKKQIRLMVIVLAIAAPFIFIRSTNSRGASVSNSSHKAIETIAARCSCLDEAGLALYAIETNESYNSIFRTKYNVFHQIGCIIDSTIPGSLFGEDADPNQYYRAMVGYMSEKDAASSYTSVNLMFPVYMVMKYGYAFGIILSIVLIYGFYRLVSRMKDPVWRMLLICIVFREMLYYFDWVMIWKSFLRAALTLITFQALSYHVSIPKIKLTMGGTHLFARKKDTALSEEELERFLNF